MAKIRQTNIELLRIWSMLMVLVIHYNVSMNGEVTHEMVMTATWKAMGVASLKSLSFICVNCFIIISGYFGIRWKWNGLCNYLFQIAFWGGLVHLLAVGFGFTIFSPLHMLNNMTMFLVNGNWFFVAYLGLYLFAPIMNAFIEKVTTKELGQMVLAFYLMQTTFGWIFKTCAEFNQGLTFVSFMGLYLLGAYLKRTELKFFQWEAAANFGVYLGVGVLCVILTIATKFVGFSKDIYSYISPLQIVQTAYLFLAFKKMRMDTNKSRDKLVLFFSSSAFAALLMHSWDGVQIYWGGLHWIDENIQMPFFASVVYIIFFFIVACCLDKSRVYCWNRVYSWLKV